MRRRYVATLLLLFTFSSPAFALITKGGGIGSWGGSANIGEDGTFTFERIPPGRYLVTGKPNPGRIDDQTEPIKVVIEGRDRHAVKLIAK